MRHADDARRGRALALRGFDQRDADRFRAQGADLAEQGGRREVGQRRGDDHRVDRARRNRSDGGIAVRGALDLPVLAQVGDVLEEIGRQAGFVAD